MSDFNQFDQNQKKSSGNNFLFENNDQQIVESRSIAVANISFSSNQQSHFQSTSQQSYPQGELRLRLFHEYARDSQQNVNNLQQQTEVELDNSNPIELDNRHPVFRVEYHTPNVNYDLVFLRCVLSKTTSIIYRENRGGPTGTMVCEFPLKELATLQRSRHESSSRHQYQQNDPSNDKLPLFMDWWTLRSWRDVKESVANAASKGLPYTLQRRNITALQFELVHATTGKSIADRDIIFRSSSTAATHKNNMNSTPTLTHTTQQQQSQHSADFPRKRSFSEMDSETEVVEDGAVDSTKVARVFSDESVENNADSQHQTQILQQTRQNQIPHQQQQQKQQPPVNPQYLPQHQQQLLQYHQQQQQKMVTHSHHFPASPKLNQNKQTMITQSPTHSNATTTTTTSSTQRAPNFVTKAQSTSSIPTLNNQHQKETNNNNINNNSSTTTTSTTANPNRFLLPPPNKNRIPTTTLPTQQGQQIPLQQQHHQQFQQSQFQNVQMPHQQTSHPQQTFSSTTTTNSQSQPQQIVLNPKPNPNVSIQQQLLDVANVLQLQNEASHCHHDETTEDEFIQLSKICDRIIAKKPEELARLRPALSVTIAKMLAELSKLP